MDKTLTPNSIILGGICGITGTVFYVLSGLIHLNQPTLYTIGMSWPILSIIFVYTIFRYIAEEHRTMANQLSFIFASLGFTIVACMISVQLAVRWGISDYVLNSSENEELLNLILKSTRLVDHGLDVAWDLFIGTSLIFLFAAIKGHTKFRLSWALPSLILGAMLIILNVLTFPWPPNSAGLIDIGPLIGVYIIALSSRLIFLGVKMKGEGI